MASIIILTSSFPFFPGEQFLEDEILYWGRIRFHEITLLPTKLGDSKRRVPSNIHLNLSLANAGWKDLIVAIIKASCSLLFYKEIFYLVENRKLSTRNIYVAFKNITHVYVHLRNISRFCADNGQIDLAYSYWNDIQSYSACLAKRKGLIKKVVSRVHNFDLYKSRRPSRYMPLKHWFLADFDSIFAISSEGKNYLIDEYGFPMRRVYVHPLGVPIPACVTPFSDDNFHVVSVSRCVSVKRIDRMIKAIAETSNRNPNKVIKWTHIGCGPLFYKLKLLAEKTLGDSKNVIFTFVGSLPNKKVREFYLQNSVDIFLNTSEYEGVPVSIMEAMSYGVPAIAPNIGGVSDVVNSNVGRLLSANPEKQEIVKALEYFLTKGQQSKLGSAARDHIVMKYKAKKNYEQFIAKLLLIVANN